MELYSNYLIGAADKIDLKIAKSKCGVVHYICSNDQTNEIRIILYQRVNAAGILLI
jgi:hypothetical protein